MSHIKLSRQEKQIEVALVKGEYVSAGKAEFKEIAEAITRRKKACARLYLSKKRSIKDRPRRPKSCVAPGRREW